MRTRWIQNKAGDLVPADEYIPESELTPHYRVVGDLHYDGLRATDGTNISTRAKHREYMKRTGLTTADDFKGEWQKARERRERFYTDGHAGDRERREQVARALYETANRRHK